MSVVLLGGSSHGAEDVPVAITDASPNGGFGSPPFGT